MEIANNAIPTLPQPRRLRVYTLNPSAIWGTHPEGKVTTGGKTTLLSVSKRGNSYLRRLLIHGARSCVQTCDRQRHPLGAWITSLEQRMHRNKVIVAVANKIARVAWKILIKPDEIYRWSEA